MASFAFILLGIFCGAVATRDLARAWRGIAGGLQIGIAALIAVIVFAVLWQFVLILDYSAPWFIAGFVAWTIAATFMLCLGAMFLFFSEDRRPPKAAPPAPSPDPSPAAPGTLHLVDRLERREEPDRFDEDDDGQLRATR